MRPTPSLGQGLRAAPTSSPPTDIASSVVQTLVLYSMAEHQLGHARSLHVTMSGHAFGIEDDGRGHAIQRTVEGAPYLDFIYCHLDFPHGEPRARPIQLQGLGMSLLNRLCANLTVTVRKAEATLTLRFEQGRLLSQELTDEANARTGNKLTGSLDPHLAAPAPDPSAFEQWLRAVLSTSPSLQLHFNGRPLAPTAGPGAGLQGPSTP